jgi:pectinesterase
MRKLKAISLLKLLPCSLLFLGLMYSAVVLAQTSSGSGKTFVMFPKDKAQNVNPDTHLEITFPSTPVIGSKGQIRIYDKADNRLVDMLDMSISAGPTVPVTGPKAPYLEKPYEYKSGKFTNANTKPGTPTGGALPTPDNFQLTIIGSFTDGFHFFPIIIQGNTAIIYPHNNLLDYNKSYYVQIDKGVLSLPDNSFNDISGKTEWVFSTRRLPPAANSEKLIVSRDSSGDFNTVQGALDFIPDYNPKHVTVFIKNGVYEEIVYFRNKTNISIVGEDRDKVIVKYANKETLNPHPANISVNEVEGSFPSRRGAFTVDHSKGIQLVNMTIRTTAYGQAEGLLMSGSENIVYNVTIGGSGDALQTNGSTYYYGSRVEGDGDIILGRGPSFFKDCEIISSGGPYMWIRNTSANHGNVFVNTKFETKSVRETELARAPTNGGKDYPYCESVLINCQLAGVSPVGWGVIGGDAANVHFWEFNSTNLKEGKPIDASKRHPYSKQLAMDKDADIIANYQKPSYVFGNWTPQMAPIIITQPLSIGALKGQVASFSIKVAAIPEATYQWFKNDKAITGATSAVLNINKVSSVDAGKYRVSVKNQSGSVSSQVVTLTV